jgi:Fe-S cluster assembly protein SufB
MDSALRDHPQIVQEYFGTIIPSDDNKFAALNTSVWSGGSFIYVPPGCMSKCLFRLISASTRKVWDSLSVLSSLWIREHTSITLKGAPHQPIAQTVFTAQWLKLSLKKAVVVDIPPFRIGSNNVFNLVTKRAVAYKNATMEWIDGNFRV